MLDTLFIFHGVIVFVLHFKLSDLKLAIYHTAQLREKKSDCTMENVAEGHFCCQAVSKIIS